MGRTRDMVEELDKFAYNISQKGKVYKCNNSIIVLDNGNEELFSCQWQILDFEGTSEDFSTIWTKFIGNNSCRSCIVENNKIKFDLTKFGFHKYKEYLIYYPFHIIYKIVDDVDNTFYIGMCEVEKNWNNNYLGSGIAWNNHLNSHKDHTYSRFIIKEDFETPEHLRNSELEEIRKYCKVENSVVTKKIDHSTGCLNGVLTTQMKDYIPTGVDEDSLCEFCKTPPGGKHKKDCPNYKGYTKGETCKECGGKDNKHLKTCSKYRGSASKCEECGAIGGRHKKSCSKFKVKLCEECGKPTSNHLKTCSHYTPRKKCPECGGTYTHKKYCSKRNGYKTCSECGYSGGHHSSDCSHYNQLTTCSECGGLNGKHKSSCSKAKRKEPCPECGSLSRHKSTCSHYDGNHCPECGGVSGHHKKTCSKFTDQGKCPECGYSKQSRKHAPTCSYYKEPKKAKPCSECGRRFGHLKTCSKYSVKICEECGGKGGHHKDSCSKSKGKCPECGYSLKSHKHAKTCSKYKPTKRIQSA